jgi:hypothetical protein
VRQHLTQEQREHILNYRNLTEKHLKQELRLNEEDEPGSLMRFQKIMAEGEVDGGSFSVTSVQGCACFYGHRTAFDHRKASDMAEAMVGRLDTYSGHLTPIEYLILKVSPGQTPAISQELGLLDDLINEVLAEMYPEPAQ